ncbi:MAG: hypothetical protein M3375_07375 [Actinomycetota bacterium]|nr:hypothetical protein [Actinomycetota bacterium]
MRHKKAAAGTATVLALGAGATAVAAPTGAGPLGGVFGPSPQERRAEQARDLAKELKLPEQRVRQAIDRVGEKRRAEHQAERAKELAKRLDVSDEDAARALAKGREALSKEFESSRGDDGLRPRGARDAFLETVAGELDKRTDEVRRALQDVRRDRLNAKLAKAVKEGRLTQKQADQVKEHAEKAPRHFRLRGGSTGGRVVPGGPHPGGPRNGELLLPAPLPREDGAAEEMPGPPPGVAG